MTSFWAQAATLARAIAKAAQDFVANKPRPAPPAASGAEIAAAAEKLQAWLPGFIAVMKAHPGVFTAADDVLDALAVGGVTWAPVAETGIDAAPEALEKLLSWMPEVLFVLNAFTPAPQPIDAPHPGWGRWGR